MLYYTHSKVRKEPVNHKYILILLFTMKSEQKRINPDLEPQNVKALQTKYAAMGTGRLRRICHWMRTDANGEEGSSGNMAYTIIGIELEKRENQ